MTNETTGVAPKDPFDDPVASNKMAIRALILLPGRLHRAGHHREG